MKKFGLFVGNGFTLDLVQPLGLHSSFPLRNFNSHNIQYDIDFINHLPYVKERLLGSDLPDFEAIKKYVDAFKDIEEEYLSLIESYNLSQINDPKYRIATDMHVQLRRFLAMAYSIFQLTVDDSDEIKKWKWTKWLHENQSDLSFAISLNYDLILENAMSLAGIPLYRVGSNEFFSRVPVIKPHGSIDFDLPNHMFDFDNPWAISSSLCDGQMVKVIPKSEWLNPRIEADIISPSLHNIHMRLSWIKKMFNQYYSIAKELNAFVIVGCSYWDVDRVEIDFFLKHLNKRTKVYILDPLPPKDLIKKIQSLGLSFRKGKLSGLPW
jgi:hypothetical protein